MWPGSPTLRDNVPRAISILLLLIFSSMLMEPLFASDPETNLPPCCRRHGKHHCMMQMMQRSDGRPGFTALHGKCPCFPKGTVAALSWLFEPQSCRVLQAAAMTTYLIAPQTESAFAPRFFDSHPKRGPPSPLA